ncbi:hypothetical protein RvY_09498-1 [Ramazzottius varieornatus]|uniref:Uncharacterized protein n=1 Tax=Ramazzottius varieornatus TaxID=947166 RepID=A0A1D1VF04_RAMVA|nr:hypothetical protein RvY_09498-1 [Ramazzottius varieornatus]
MKFDPLTRKLMQLAGMGAIVTVSFGTITRRKVKKTFEDMPIYKESVEILLANPHIQSYLGEPLRVFGVEIGDKSMVSSEDFCRLVVKAKGSKSQGVMYVEAEKSAEEDTKAVIKSIEFELEKPRGRMKLQ